MSKDAASKEKQNIDISEKKKDEKLQNNVEPNHEGTIEDSAEGGEMATSDEEVEELSDKENDVNNTHESKDTSETNDEKEDSKNEIASGDKAAEESTPASQNNEEVKEEVIESTDADENPIIAENEAEEKPKIANDLEVKEEETEGKSSEKIESDQNNDVLAATESETPDAKHEIDNDIDADGETEDSDSEDEDDDDHDADHDKLLHADYSSFSKEELLETIEQLTKYEDFSKVDSIIKIINPIFSKITNKEKQEALEKYIKEGGSKEDFSYKDLIREKFYASYKLIKDRKHKHFDELGKQKQANYEKATELLEHLRVLVDGEESTTSINAVKSIQAEWKALGHVPSQHVRPLWASYNALMDRFYDNRSIYFELKELDRKKNLEAKLALCERAEALKDVENLKESIKELNELHDEFKHIGPVPKEEQEALWTRFKSASDNVYARRKSYYEDLKKDFESNFVEKDKLREEVQPFAEFASDRIVDWNKKTKEILDIQKRWEKIGGVPKEKAAMVNKPFWSAFKKFFNNKNNFFKQLEGQREENYKLKEELVEKAEELKASTDWNQTAGKLKQLQQDWRNIGPVPEKKRNELYEKFKAACDHFFENRRNRFKEEEKEFEVNLKQKNEICQKIEDLAGQGEEVIEELESLQAAWNEIGFVPKNAIKSSQKRFAAAVDKFIESLDIDEHEKEKFKITTQLTSLKGTPNANRKLNKKEFTLRKQISNLENDITLWNNNLEFFANSKNADQLRKEFDVKIENAKKELESLKEQLKIIKDI